MMLSAVINPADGVGATRDANYVTQTNSTKSRGIAVIGYVYTQYGARSLSTIKAKIDKYYQWYDFDGIFLDELCRLSTLAAQRLGERLSG